MASIVRILNRKGKTQGTGFIAHPDGLIVTCAHVIVGGGYGQGSEITVELYANKQPYQATVEVCTMPQDVAVLRLQGELPTDAGILPLGTSRHLAAKHLKTFGFPLAKPIDGLPGDCEIVGPTTEDGFPVVTLRSNEVSLGFSGAPCWHPTLLCAVGIVVSVVGLKQALDVPIPVPIDPAGKQLQTSFMRPIEVVRRECPALELPAVCPYRGLEPFTEDDMPYYFGRDQAVDAVIASLAEHPLTTLVGLSGSGKSSLMRAGLKQGLARYSLATLAGRETRLFEPGRNPTLNLLACLAGLAGCSWDQFKPVLMLPAWPLSESQEELQRSSCALATRSAGEVVEAIRHALGARRVLLLVDQFEQVYTECAEADVAKHFVDVLVALAGPAVKVLLGVRADYFGQALRHERLSQVLQQAQVTVISMCADELREAITEPARLTGRALEPGLVEELVLNVSGRVGDLLLLEFALQKIWEMDGDDGVLTLQTYHSLRYKDPQGNIVAGVLGIFINRAEAVWSGLSAEEQGRAERILLSLVSNASYHGSSELPLQNSGRRTFLSEYDRATAMVAQALLSSFLLTAGQDLLTNQPTIQVSHEALLWSWPRMATLIERYRPFLAWYGHEFAPHLDAWLSHGESDDYLLPKSMLPEGERWLTLHPQNFTGAPEAFLRASIAAHERARRIARRAKLGALVAVVVIWGLIIVLVFGIRQRGLLAARDDFEQAQIALSQHDFTQAEMLLAQSLIKDDRTETREWFLNARMSAPSALLRLAAAEEPLAISRDGSRIAYRTAAGALQVRDGHTLRVIDTLPQTSWIVKASFDSEGKSLVAGCKDGSVFYWRTSLRAPVSRPQVRGKPITGVAISGVAISDGDKDGNEDVAFANEAGDVWVWNTPRNVITQIKAGAQDPLWSLCFDGAGSRLAAAGEDKTLWIWRRDSGVWRQALHKQVNDDVISCVAFQPHGRLIATSGADTSIRLIDSDTGKEVTRLLGHSGSVDTLCFDEAGSQIVSGGGDETVRVWQVTDGRLWLRLSSEGGPVRRAAFLDGGTKIVFACGHEKGAQSVTRTWNLRSASLGYDLPTAGITVSTIAYSPNGRLVAGGGANLRLTAGLPTDASSRIIVWDAITSKIVRVIASQQKNVNALAFSPESSLLAGGGSDGTIRLWRTTNWTSVPPVPPGHGEIYAAAFSPDGTLFASGREEKGHSENEEEEVARIVVTRLSPPKKAILLNHGGSVFSLAVRPDGQIFATGDGNGTVRLWNAAVAGMSLTSQPLTAFSHSGDVWAVAFDRSGSMLASGSTDGYIQLYDLKSNAICRKLPVRGNVYSLAFSPSEDVFASGTDDSVTRLWDTTNFTSLALREQAGPIWWVAFDPTGGRLVSASLDGTVRVRNLKAIRLIMSADASKLLTMARVDQTAAEVPAEPSD